MTDVGLELVAADERGCVDAAVKKDVILRIYFAGGPLCAIFFDDDNDRTQAANATVCSSVYYFY